MKRPPAFSLSRALGAWALLLPGVVAFQPAFGGLRGYAAAFVGITVGAAIALVAARFRWSTALWFAALLGSYLLIGGPLVLPETMIAGVIPSLETLRRLVLLIFQGWMDLLTVATPAGDLSGPAAVPLLAGLLFGAATMGVVRLTRAVVWPLLLPLGWLAMSIAFGVRSAPTAAWLGAALGAGLLVWLTAHRLSRSRAVNSEILVRRDQGMSRATAKVLSAGLVIALATVAAVGVNLLTGDRVNRQVLRDTVAPPLNLQEYASPLTRYRLYEGTLKDEVLFRVSGMPEGSRLRLAVLDTWDGTVFNVSQASSQYLRSGRELPWTPDADPTRAEVTAVGYDDVWVPSFGDSSSIEFSGDRATAQARGLYYNRTTHQALTTGRLAEGTALIVDAVPVVLQDEAEREALAEAGIGRSALAEVSRVPDVLVKAATDWTSEATSAYGQLEIIAERLRAEGFYSDGSDGKSRSGHTAERLATMFNQPQWVGDDEQYATAMALMATQLGIPVRVVMGFHPLEGDAPTEEWDVTGTQAHVWVEADLDGAGWVAFDPTPDRDKVPQTDVPRPKPKPKPQVDPPPNPPEKLPDEPIVADESAVNVDEEDDGESNLGLILTIIGAAAGGLLLAASPFLLIGALKASRAKKRRTSGEVADQIAGAWEEIVDRARDLGHSAPSTWTRREAAATLQQSYPGLPVEPVAHRIDASIFGAGSPAPQESDHVWGEVDVLRGALLATRPWYARPAALFSTRSLRRRAPQSRLKRAPRAPREWGAWALRPRRTAPPKNEPASASPTARRARSGVVPEEKES